MRYPGFIGGTGEQQSIMAGVSRTINLMPEIVEGEPGKNQAVLNGTPGLVLWNTVGAGPIKLLDPTPTDISGTPYIHVVSGNTLYRVKWSDGSGAVSIGALTAADDPYIANGFYNMSLVVSGGTAYSLDKATDTLTAIGALSGITAIGAGMLDSYFLTSDGFKVYYSSPNDPTAWDLLDFNTAMADTDAITSIWSKHGELWLFKSRSTEPFYNSGDTLVPFQRIPGASLTIGPGGASQSVAKLDQSFIFMGMDLNGGGIIYQTTNFIPQRISTHAVEKAIRGYSNAGGAIAWSFVLRGHYIYVISFPNAGTAATWAYDTNTKQWFEWLSWDGAAFGNHIARNAGVGSDWLVGSRIDGKIYKLRDDAYDEAGISIKRLRRCPHLCDEKKVFTFSDFELDMEPGLGAVASAPTAELRYSNDGGKTWVGPISTSLGETPDYKVRAIWRRLGSARDRVFEVSSTAAIKHCWTDAFINNLG